MMEQAEKEWLEKRWPQLKAIEIAHKLQKEILEWEEVVGKKVFDRQSEEQYRKPVEEP